MRESYTGAWQRNVEVDSDTVLTYFAVYACISLISQDIGKLTPKLVQKSGDVWVETTNPAYSKILRQPNNYQNWQKFAEQWIISKLSYGATYTLKSFDNRKVVNGLNVLDAQRVVPLVAQDGSVFYDIKKDNLNGVESGYIAVDDEIIHDIYTPLYHPLMGVSPIVACGLTATQGLNIQQNSTNLFANMSRPSGMLMAPGSISPETAARLKTQWEENYSAGNYGRVAILSDGLTYTPMAVNAADAQLIEQLRWTAETVCSVFKVPPFKIGIGQMPSNTENIEALDQTYYSQCLQTLIQALETLLTEGLNMPSHLRVSIDLSSLLKMDTFSRYRAWREAMHAGWITPNEIRQAENRAPVDGGDTPYLQQQNYPLYALERNLPDVPGDEELIPEVEDEEPEEVEDEDSDDEIEELLLYSLVQKKLGETT